MVAKLLSTELSLFSFCEALLLEGWGSAHQDLVVAVDALSSLCPWQSLREDTTSSSNTGAQEETLEVCVICRPPGIVPAVLFPRFLVPPAEWQVHLPLGLAEATSASGLGGLSILPLSTLWLLHAETFHPSLPSSEGCLLPIESGPQGRAQHPSPTPSPGPISPHQQPAAWQPETSPSYYHTF